MTSTPSAAPRSRALVLGAAVALAVAVVGALLAGAFTDAFAPTGPLDPGAVVRHALPVVTVVVELALAVTVGSLVLVTVVVPWRAPSDGVAFRRTTTLAVTGSAVWALASLVQLVLEYATIAGVSLGDPAFGAQLGSFVTQVDYGRTALEITIVAALVSMLALTVRTPTGAAWATVLALVAVALQADTGHAAGMTDHELAVSSLFVHLVGAACWIGGLAALGAALAGRGRHGDASALVSRYSQIAGWCLVLVAVSGVVNGWIRVGSWSGVETRYGVLILVKVALLCVLGLFGYAHRTFVIARLGRPGARPQPLFWRLAAVELGVMGAVSGVAVALASSAPPVSTAGPAAATAAERITGRALPPEPSLVHWLTGRLWDLPLALACAAGLVVYGGWVLRAGRTAGAAGAAAGTRRWPARRTVAWVAGVLVLAWATCGGPGLYADVLFSAHTFRLLVLATLVPVLLVLGAPVTLALDVLPTRTDGSRGPREWLTTLAGSRAGRFVADVRVAAPLLVGTLLAFTYTGLLTWSLGSYVGQLTATVLALGSGCLFTNALLRGRSAVGRPASGRVAAAPPERRTLVPFGVVCVCLALLGYVLAGSDVLLAPDWFGLLGRPWGPSAIDDQQRAGVVVWVVSAVWASACAAVLVVRTRSRPPGPGVGPRDRTVR